MKYPAYPEYKPSNTDWIGSVPEYWEVKRLRFLLCARFTNGLFKKAEFWGDGNRIINVTDLYTGNDLVDETHLDRLECNAEELKTYSANHGDFFVVRSSLKLQGIGKSAVLINPSEATVFECHIVRGRPNLDEVHPRFLNLFMNSAYARQYFMTRSNVVTMATIDQERIKSLVVALPGYVEQQQIAAFLDWKTGQIDALIAKKQELIEKLKEKRLAVITQAVTKGLNPAAPQRDSGIPWLGQVPERWEVKRLKFSVSKVGSGVTPKGGAETYETSGIPFLRSQNIHFEALRLDDVVYISEEVDSDMENSRTAVGDVLLNITGASIGRCNYVDEALPKANVNQHVCIIRPEEILLTKYLHFLMWSQIGQMQIDIEQSGSGREGLNFVVIKNFIFPLPKIGEQKEIVLQIEKTLNELESLLVKVETAIEHLTEYRTGLITATTTGKIDVRSLSPTPPPQAGEGLAD